jgi:hypothetical protein
MGRHQMDIVLKLGGPLTLDEISPQIPEIVAS